MPLPHPSSAANRAIGAFHVISASLPQGTQRANRTAWSPELQLLTDKTCLSVFEDAMFPFHSTFFNALSHWKQGKICQLHVLPFFPFSNRNWQFEQFGPYNIADCSLRALLAPLPFFFPPGRCAFIVRPPRDILDPAGSCDRSWNSWERYPLVREGLGKGQGRGSADVRDLNACGSSSAGPQLLPSPPPHPSSSDKAFVSQGPFQSRYRTQANNRKGANQHSFLPSGVQAEPAKPFARCVGILPNSTAGATLAHCPTSDQHWEWF